jgi:hypothetical protein
VRFSDEQRREYLSMIDRVGVAWLDVFEGNREFYSANYWDLLTELWRHPDPVRQTDALRCMKAVRSAHTAGKYLDEALRQVELAPDMRQRLDRFFDHAVEAVLHASRAIDKKDK